MICWIHGALSTDRSFNYLRPLMPPHEYVVFEYTVDTPLGENLKNLEEFLRDKPIRAIVGHSLGGVMAAVMIKRLNIPKGVSLSSPFRGSYLANFLPVSQMLVDIRTTSPVFTELNKYTYDDNFLSVVTGGISLHMVDTDGVVSVASQKALRGNRIVELPLNHFEVLLDDHVAEIVKDHLFP